MARTKVTRVTFKDMGWNALKKRMLDKPPATYAEIGVFDTSKHPLRGDLTVEEIALLNEFGSRNGRHPQRSFLRRTFWWNARNRVAMIRMMADVSRKAIFNKVERAEAMHEVGRWGVAEVKRTIAGGVGPANARATLESKPDNLGTLRHTLTLLDAITYRIVQGGRGSNAATIGLTKEVRVSNRSEPSEEV